MLDRIRASINVLFRGNPQIESMIIHDQCEIPKPRVHIGCGPINLEGWINIDAREAPHIHIATDKINLQEFSDASIGVIYISHVLEHFSFAEVEALLNVFHKKLKPDGVLYVAIPDFSKLVDIYNKFENLEELKRTLMGGQEYAYNFHKSIYDMEILSRELLKAGFRSINVYDTINEFGMDIGDYSTYKIKDHPISLNVKAFK